MQYDFLIVGSGLFGSVFAYEATKLGKKCLVIEKRDHIGGNCYDGYIQNTLCHQYGPHIFHTDDEQVIQFLNRYTEWVPFKLQPKGNTKLGLISLPYSRKTVAELGRELSQEEIVEYIFIVSKR